MSLAYVGGKYRQSKVWAPLILKMAAEKFHPGSDGIAHGSLPHYLEPFCGGCSVLEKVAPYFQTVQASDLNPDLILLWKAVQAGTPFPNHISKEEYLEFKAQTSPSALRGFAGFGCGFCGIFFAPYHDGAAKTNRTLSKTCSLIQNVLFECKSYKKTVGIGSQSVVYCDPPYLGTGGFNRKSGGVNKDEPFNHDEFWETMRKWRSTGALLFISEYQAPPDFACISEVELAVNSMSKKNGAKQKDRLWM